MRHRTRSLTTFLLASLLLLISALPGAGAAAQTLIRLDKQLIDGEWQDNEAAAPMPTELAHASAIPSQYTGDVEPWARLVFASYRSGNWEIYRYYTFDNTRTEINLTKSSRAQDTRPRMNRAADQIVFVSDRDRNPEIYRMDINGANLVRLTVGPAEDTQPFWSPDGQRIIFASRRDGNWNIYGMNADGSGQVALTTDPSDDVMPSMSPDGKTIAWVRAGVTTGVIWLMNADGTNQRAITGPLTYLQHPSWSPDSTRLAFDYDRDGDSFNDLGIVNANGSGLLAVPVPSSSPYSRLDLAIGGWSPEGARLLIGAVTYNLTDPPSIYNAYIGRVPTSGGEPTALIFPEYDAMPDMRSLDLIPPRTVIGGLPAYSRAGATLMQWSSEDTGGSGMGTYDVQYRVGLSGAWTNWQTGISATSASFTGVAGTQVFFRVRGRDVASNTEAWRAIPTGDTFTTFYTWALSGGITDNRGQPIPAASLGLTPAALSSITTDSSGAYVARLKTNGNHTALPAHAGYLSPPVTTLAMNQDREFNAYLLPTDNRIQNGGFEASATQLSGWIPAGTLPAAVTTSAVHTGNRAALLGQPCTASCLTTSERVITMTLENQYGDPIALVAGADGTVHMVSSEIDTSVLPPVKQLIYRFRPNGGAWSAPVNLGNGVSPRLVIDQQNNLHVLAIVNIDLLTYRWRPAGGNWSQPIEVGHGDRPNLYADPDGSVYAVYSCANAYECDYGTTYYRARVPGSGWQPPRVMPGPNPLVFSAADNTLQLIWKASDGSIYYSPWSVHKSLSPRLISTGWPLLDIKQAVLDPQGSLHLFLMEGGYQGYYVSCGPDQSCTTPEPLPHATGRTRLLVDRQGVLHLINAGDTNDPGVYYRYKSPFGTWIQPAQLSTAMYADIAIATDIFGQAHLMIGGYYLRTREAAAGTASLSQVVIIPPALHKPTLAFDYALSGVTTATGSRLDVTVTRGITAEQIFSMTMGGSWSHAAIDMQRWSGQTVSVTIALRQADSAPTATALIDDVSLGSWLTPVILGVTPQKIDNPAVATTITITGENFLATPIVRLNSTALTGVQRIDERTIHVTIPAGFKPGRYELWITNPGGQAGVMPVLWIGKQVLLPLIGS